MALKYVFKYLKKCAFSAKIRDFGFDARSIPVVVELSNFNTCVFSPIGTFFAVMQNFSKKKNVILSHPNMGTATCPLDWSQLQLNVLRIAVLL